MPCNHPHNSLQLQEANTALEEVYFLKLEKLANLNKLAALVVTAKSLSHGEDDRKAICPFSGLQKQSSEPPHAEGGCDGCFRDFLIEENAVVDAALAAEGQPQAAA